LFKLINLYNICILIFTKQPRIVITYKMIFKNIIVFKLCYFQNTFPTCIILPKLSPNYDFSKQIPIIAGEENERNSTVAPLHQ